MISRWIKWLRKGMSSGVSRSSMSREHHLANLPGLDRWQRRAVVQRFPLWAIPSRLRISRTKDISRRSNIDRSGTSSEASTIWLSIGISIEDKKNDEGPQRYA